MKSVMKHAFSMIPRTEIQRSAFNRSSGYKTTFNEGYLIPFYCDEILPGDTFKLKHSILARLMTPIVPFMDNVFLETFFFFVPYRLVWENWQKFNGERENPEDSTDFLVPQLTSPSGGFSNMSIFDYFGLPTKIAGFKFNTLPFRAYNLIWNEWFRDENLQDSVTVEKGDSDNLSYYTLLKRGKRHDYFTSCLPWPQKGDAVNIPLSGVITSDSSFNDINLAHNFSSESGSSLFAKVNLSSFNSSSSNKGGLFITGATAVTPNLIVRDTTPYSESLTASFSQFDDNVRVTPENLASLASKLHVTAGDSISVNDLRMAFQVQRMLERDARGGTRYTELLRSHFGVISPDARLQRPEYLGGSSTKLNVDPVAQTSQTSSDTTPQGNLAAFGYFADHKSIFNRSFVEHGIIIGLLNVRADLTYQQGLERFWSRQTRYDFYWPSLAHLGEQAVLNKEIYTQGSSVVDEDGNVVDEKVFGYQERFAEYRYKNSLITGKLRSNDTNTLDFWHLSQNFANLPTLSSDFIEDNPPINRVVAVQDEPHFIADVYFHLNCVRPMPLYSVPGLIDHF